jgi:energy-converting hydrogenase A subunit M
MTVAQLEQALLKKKGKLESLLTRREKLQRQLDKVQRQIDGIAGRSTEGGLRRRKRRRPRNTNSLRAIVMDLLAKSKKGLSISELHERVEQTGYRTRSKNFRNVLYQCLYNTDGIAHEKETGKYILKG